MKDFTTDNTHELVSQLAKREDIEPSRIIEIISQSFKEAYNAEKENNNKVEIQFSHDKGTFTAYRVYRIVEKVENSDEEVVTDDERLRNDDNIKISDNKALFLIDIKNLPRFIAYRIRKNIEKFIQEIRKEKQYHNFLPLKGEIVTGHIQSIQENFCMINLGKGLGYWDKREWNFEDKNYLGKNMRFLLVDVNEKADLRQIILSRKGEVFLRKLFELEIPEIKENIVEIKKVLHIPTLVSKIIVSSRNPRIDPVGTCIGKQGMRIRSIIKEVKKERIDLVAWNEDKRKLLFNLISPVEIISVIEENEQKWILFIPEYRMSLALYGGGRVVQKIEEYLEVKLHIRSFGKSQDENIIVVWNGNISFNDYELQKNFFNSKQKEIDFKKAYPEKNE